MEPLKEPAKEVVENGQVQFYPARWKQVYLDWLDNLKDWCISRQLWWGHRIPMYYCDQCGWEDASVDPVEVCPVCGAPVRQDEDVLDTWFSSQLWPFATQGWGDEGMQSPDLQKYYPTQLLSTARDIMGLWVARMIMASEYCCDEIPFQDVIIHPTVMGSDGKPMSKSRGNGVDPMVLMENYGADAMRFGLLMQVTGSQAMRFDENKLVSSRNFANKIRNAARFVMMNLDGYTPGAPAPSTLADRWMFSRLASLVAKLDEAYVDYDFGAITRELYAFFWNEFCDWYIELSKARLHAGGEDKLVCQRNLIFVLNTALRLLHPIMPFVTEKIYQDLPEPKDPAYLMMAPWPDAQELSAYLDPAAEKAIDMVMGAVSGVRSVRSRYNISPKVELEVVVSAEDDASLELFAEQQALICALASIKVVESGIACEKPQESAAIIAGGVGVYVLLAGLVDFEVERKRLEKEIATLEKDQAKFEKKLSNPGFLAKAAQEIIDKDSAKLADITDRLSKLRVQLAEM